MAPSIPGGETGLDEATLARITELGYKSPAEWRGFQSVKDQEIHGLREQVIGFQQQARSAGLMSQNWEQAYQQLAEEIGEPDRYKLKRADLMDSFQEVANEERQRYEANANALTTTLKAATDYVKQHAIDPDTGEKLFEPNDPEIRAAINDVMNANRQQLMATDQASWDAAGIAVEQAAQRVRALVRQREAQGYRRRYGLQSAQANRQQHQQNGPMVTPSAQAGGGGGLDFASREQQLRQANPNWTDEQVFVAALAQDIEASLSTG